MGLNNSDLNKEGVSVARRFLKAHWKIISGAGSIFAVSLMVLITIMPMVNGDLVNVNVNNLPYMRSIDGNVQLHFENASEYSIIIINVTQGYVNIENHTLKRGDIYVYETQSNSTLNVGGKGEIWIGRIAYGDYIYLNIKEGAKRHVYGYPYLSFRDSKIKMIKLRFPYGVYTIKDNSSGYENRWFVSKNVTFPYSSNFTGDSYIMRFDRDADGFVNIEIKRIKSIVNLPPKADGDGDKVVYVGEEVNFEGWRSVDYDGAIINYTWNFGDGEKGYGINTTHTYMNPGRYVATLTVVDTNLSAMSDAINVTVLPRVEYPEFTYSINGSHVRFTGIDNYTWYFGDGHMAKGKSVEHTYARGGEYRVMAVGRHNETKVVNIEIIAPPPKVFISPHTYVGFEGDTVHFHANVTSYDKNVSVVWYIKGHEYYGRDVNYTFTDDYTGYVICMARDSIGQSGEDRSRVIINNVQPKINGMRAYMYADITVRVAGKPHHRIHFEIYDNDELYVNKSIDRECGPPQTLNISHVYFNMTHNYRAHVWVESLTNISCGANPVWVNFSFEDGSNTLHNVLILHGHPHWHQGCHNHTWYWNFSVSEILSMHRITFSAHGYDRGADFITFNWDFGDGSWIMHKYFKNATDTVKHTYTKEGVYTVHLRLRDDDGGHDDSYLQIVIWHGGNVSFVNHPPECSIDASTTTAKEDQVIYFEAECYDEDGDSLNYTWDFGDGSVAYGANVNHSYSHMGNYSVTLYVNDGYTVNQSSMIIHVYNVPPTVKITGKNRGIECELLNYTAMVNDTPSDEDYVVWYVDGKLYGYGLNFSVALSYGVHELKAVAVDDDNAIGIDEINVSIENFVPHVYLFSHDMIVYNQTVKLYGDAFDMPCNALSFRWYVNSTYLDNTTEHRIYEGKEPTVHFNFSGVANITLVVSDGITTVKKETEFVMHLDVDHDMLPDEWELRYGLDPRDSAGANGPYGDPDRDGLNNLEEYRYALNPESNDTDGDGLLDGEEIKINISYPSVNDTDGDGLNDCEEVMNYYPYEEKSVNVTLNGNERYEIPLYWDATYRVYLNLRNSTNILVNGAKAGSYYLVRGDKIIIKTNYSFESEENTTILNFTIWKLGLDPRNPDTDFDGIPDNEDEYPGNPDGDGDYLADEVKIKDDGDRLPAGLEIQAGTPLNERDRDNDSLDDLAEMQFYYYTNSSSNSIRFFVYNYGWYKIACGNESKVLRLARGWHYFSFPNQSSNTPIYVTAKLLSPYVRDYDGDDLPDGEEGRASPYLKDTDNDGLSDLREVKGFGIGNLKFYTDPRSKDTDHDGLSDYFEATHYYIHNGVYYLNPLKNDTDGDLLDDGKEFNYWKAHRMDNETAVKYCDIYDVDNDSMPDGWEIKYNLNPLYNDTMNNSDDDSLNNVGEWNFGTNPTKRDTDGDHLPDDEIGNIIFRTSVSAVSLNAYLNLSSDDWIVTMFGNNTNSYFFSGYYSTNRTLNNPALKIGTGSLYVINSTAYVGPLYADKNDNTTIYHYAMFNETNRTVGDYFTSPAPLPFFKGKEIYDGTSPTNKDTNGDGVYDGESTTGIYVGNVSVIHDVSGDHDKDNASDYREVYTIFRVSNDFKFIAVNLTWNNTVNKSSAIPVLTVFKNTSSMMNAAGHMLGRDYFGNPIYLLGNDTIVYRGYAYSPTTGGISTSPNPIEEYVATGHEVHYSPLTLDKKGRVLGSKDSDGDGIKDGDEPLYWYDVDHDGYPGMLDTDSDSDGISDGKEDVNHNGKLDANETSPIMIDTDGDGLADGGDIGYKSWMPSTLLRNKDGEVIGEKSVGTNSTMKDSDNDGLEDGYEVVNMEGAYRFNFTNYAVSGNFTLDEYLYNHSLTVRVDNDSYGKITAGNVSVNFDNGGISWRDGKNGGTMEMKAPYSFTLRISGGVLGLIVNENRTNLTKEAGFVAVFEVMNVLVWVNGIVLYAFYSNNATNKDIDKDGLLDGEEVKYHGDIYSNDTDGDGLSDGEEVKNGTDVGNPDTDGDGLSDGTEVHGWWANYTLPNGTEVHKHYTSSPLHIDSDHDGLTDEEEKENYTNPENPDTDSDGIPDGAEMGKSMWLYNISTENLEQFFHKIPYSHFILVIEIKEGYKNKIWVNGEEKYVNSNYALWYVFPAEKSFSRGEDISLSPLSEILSIVAVEVPNDYNAQLHEEKSILPTYKELNFAPQSEGYVYSAKLEIEKIYDWRENPTRNINKKIYVTNSLTEAYEFHHEGCLIKGYHVWFEIRIYTLDTPPDVTVTVDEDSNTYQLEITWTRKGNSDLYYSDVEIDKENVYVNKVSIYLSSNTGNSVELELNNTNLLPNSHMHMSIINYTVVDWSGSFTISAGSKSLVYPWVESMSKIELPAVGMVNAALKNNTNIRVKFDGIGAYKVKLIYEQVPKISSPICADTDMDGVKDNIEYNITSSILTDSDNDSFFDGYEYSVITAWNSTHGGGGNYLYAVESHTNLWAQINVSSKYLVSLIYKTNSSDEKITGSMATIVLPNTNNAWNIATFYANATTQIHDNQGNIYYFYFQMSLANANVANIYLSPLYFTNTPFVDSSTITVFNPDPRRNYTVGLNISHDDGSSINANNIRIGNTRLLSVWNFDTYSWVFIVIGQAPATVDLNIEPLSVKAYYFGSFANTTPNDDDTDGDGIPDGSDPNPVVADSDGDGLVDGVEKILGTDPRNADTDGDGLTDGAEVLKYGTNPLNPDTDGDMLVDGAQANFDKVSWKYVKRFSHVYEELNNTWSDYGKIWGEMAAETGTNPHLFDTDHDGIGDGAELQNLSMLGIPQGDWAAILHAWDYDNDSIPDGFEIRMAYWASKYDTSAYENGSYLNVTNSTDASLDFDSDGLTNLEEYQRDPSGDYDGDGTPDIYDNDDDNDSILTSVEVQNHLNPYNPLDAAGDLDHDGLSNLFESKHGLNIQDADTDHDGIDDGDELNYWNVTRGLDMDTAISYCKIPDVDGDKIIDGKEIKGYKVKIITGWQKDGTPISEMRYISPDELDPLTPYRNSTGALLDTDKDGIPDVVESWFSNSSIATSYNYRMRFIHKFGNSLYSQYSWVISYFHTVKNKQNESSAKKWLRDQFNPLIVEHTPPQVVKFKVKFYYYLLTAYVEYHVVVRDSVKISKVVFKNLDNGDVRVFTPDSGYLEFSGSFYATPWGANLGFKLKLFARDVAGNKMTVEKEIKGPVGQWIEVLAKIWSEIWNTLVEVGKAIAKGLSVIFQFVMSIIENVINTALRPLISMAESWVKEIAIEVANLLFPSRQNSNMNAKELISTIFSGKIIMLCMGAAIAISSLISAVGIFMDIFTGGASEIISVTVIPVLQEMMINFLKNTVLSMALTNGLIVSVMVLLTYLIPQNSPVWGDILPIVQVITSSYFSKQIGESMVLGGMTKVSWDWQGLLLSFAALIIDFAVSKIINNLNMDREQTRILKIALYAISAGFAIIGFLRTLKMDPIDMFIGGPLSMLEEILSLMTVVTIGVNIGLALSS